MRMLEHFAVLCFDFGFPTSLHIPFFVPSAHLIAFASRARHRHEFSLKRNPLLGSSLFRIVDLELRIALAKVPPISIPTSTITIL